MDVHPRIFDSSWLWGDLQPCGNEPHALPIVGIPLLKHHQATFVVVQVCQVVEVVC